MIDGLIVAIHNSLMGRDVFWLETSVFPLLDIQLSADGGAPKPIYKGTCFLTILAGNHVFVTAKHLLDHSPDKYNLFLSYNTREDQPAYMKVSAGYVNHKKQDISFFIPTAEMKEQYKDKFVPMQLFRNRLAAGQRVLTYGFAGSQQSEENGGIPVVTVNRTRHEGVVLAFEDDYPLAQMPVAMPTVYHLGFPSPWGLSGSPILGIHENKPVVAGYIIGEMNSNGQQIAIGTDLTPLVEIEKLLIDVFRELST